MKRIKPFISVIVPTYNRPDQLLNCLQSLTKSDYPHDRFEVIVVDDGGELPLDDIVALARDRIDVTLITQQKAGPATARNTGAKRAKGEILAFTDDDCAPAPEWLTTLAKGFTTAPDYAICGRTINALDNRYSRISQLLIDYLFFYYNSDKNKARFFTSNNFALPANQFREIGGFKTSFALPAGEDREFCDRWLFGGYKILYAPDAVVYHYHLLTIFSFIQQHYRYGQGAFRFRQASSRDGKGKRYSEPLSFYINLILYPSSLKLGWKTPLFLTLMVVTQVANATGFFVEKIKHEIANFL